ncbi:electron transfer flavoprotein beta subunit [Clostridium amylolyticum]|uniref:Electron transfer flavoprotein small subunit n=1 Tax=Clostridium amylolyticum TaxID=1121298 RepID=A0A1M6F9J1_9CLOT|nr:electron transfer flavoprotein subunit beta/FixA family protein [Clostridium amylolyticum]SHI94398.1 electron transfer flavoprotein beta subunit [Clostridium amylolyticum]
MNVMVCIKQVPDTSEINIDAVTGVLKRNEANSQINPYDLYALETALRIKEEKGGKVSVVTLGDKGAAQIIKEAYMMGVDEGFLISHKAFNGSDLYATALILSQVISSFSNLDLIILGKKSTDSGTGHLSSELAELMGFTDTSNVRRIVNIEDSFIIVESDMGDALGTLEIKTPCVLSVEEDIFEPRLLSFRKRLESKDKAIKVISLEDLENTDENFYGLKGSPTHIRTLFSSKDSTLKEKEASEKKIADKGSPINLQRVFPEGVAPEKEVWTGASLELAESIYSKLKDLKYI